MCSFLVTSRKYREAANFYLQKRGPDQTTTCRVEPISFTHNLLSITGDLTPQPLHRGDAYLVFNGEIYNYDQHQKFSSDGYFILECYHEFHERFFHHLDGEFALVLVDFAKRKVFFSGDLFLTKPIYFSIEENEFGISTYRSALEKLKFKNIQRCRPNTHYEFCLDRLELRSHGPIYAFNLSQATDSFEPWTEAFLNALRKRTKNTRGTLVVPLSSGHDSGCIVCGLGAIGFTDYVTYSFAGLEDQGVMESRLKKIRNQKQYLEKSITRKEVKEIRRNFGKTVEPFFYGYDEVSHTAQGFDDLGAIGLYKILQTVKKNHQIKVQLSGQGGDEITGNVQTYGFGGKWNPREFPEDLGTVFPWANFYYGCNYSYLQKEECIAGSLGIETRYPLLDREVVQQFLHLTRSLKNSLYKAPLTHFMSKNDFPYLNEKRGFNLLVK